MKKILALSLAFAGFAFAASAQTDRVVQSAPDNGQIRTRGGNPMRMQNDQMMKDLNLTDVQKEQMKKNVMKDFTCPMHKEIVSDMAGTCAKCGTALVVVDRTGSKQGRVTYVCSMHPEVSAGKSGKCPKCGMALKKAKS